MWENTRWLSRRWETRPCECAGGDLAREGYVLPVLIHPSAVVSPSAEVGYGTVICARAVIGPGAEIPEGTHILCGQAVAAGRKFDREGVLLYG